MKNNKYRVIDVDYSHGIIYAYPIRFNGTIATNSSEVEILWSGFITLDKNDIINANYDNNLHQLKLVQ
jgi:hypothetical protein